MAWQQLIPTNTGGGRRRHKPAVRIYASGQITFTHDASELIGTPPKIIVEYNSDSHAVRVRPAVASDASAFAFSGGGNSSYRIMCRQLLKLHPDAVGTYDLRKVAHGVELVPKDD